MLFLFLQRLLLFHLLSLRFLRLLFLFIGSLLLVLLLHHITPRPPSPPLPTSFLLLLVIRPWTLASPLLSFHRSTPICCLWLRDSLLHFPAPPPSSPLPSLPLLIVITTYSATSLPSLPSPTVMLPPLCPTLLPPWMKLFLSTSTFPHRLLLLTSIVCLFRAILSPSLLLLPFCRHFLLQMLRLPRTLMSSRCMLVMLPFLHTGYFMLHFLLFISFFILMLCSSSAFHSMLLFLFLIFFVFQSITAMLQGCQTS